MRVRNAVLTDGVQRAEKSPLMRSRKEIQGAINSMYVHVNRYKEIRDSFHLNHGRSLRGSRTYRNMILQINALKWALGDPRGLTEAEESFATLYDKEEIAHAQQRIKREVPSARHGSRS